MTRFDNSTFAHLEQHHSTQHSLSHTIHSHTDPSDAVTLTIFCASCHTVLHRFYSGTHSSTAGPKLEQHASHDTTVTLYGTQHTLYNVSIECRDCCLVLYDIEPDRNY